MNASSHNSASGVSSKPPLLRYLERCHAGFSTEEGGAVADYIPELSKADPAHFGISLATLDGHVYEVGDSSIPSPSSRCRSRSCSHWRSTRWVPRK
jgi:glutaminase